MQAEAEEEEDCEVILSEAERSRRIPWQDRTVFHRDSSTSLGMTG